MASAIDVVTPRQVYAEYGRSLIIRPAEDEDPDAFFDQICADFENTKIEQDAEGSVYVMAPTGGESSYQNSELTMQLRLWAKRDGRGRAFDSSALFILPDRSRFSPDGAWVSNEKLAALSPAERRKFLRLVPEFVIELKSPSDHLIDLQRKMGNWMRNGVELGWLIDPGKRCVYVYTEQTADVEMTSEESILGEGSVSGFELDLRPIWEGLTL
jgi:Uma2 family endonuclease